MLFYFRRYRVLQGGQNIRVGLRVDVLRVVRIEQGVRLMDQNLDAQHVAGGRRDFWRDAVLCEPVLDGLHAFGLRRHERLDL